MSIASCKTAVSPLLMHWRYCSLAQNQQCMFIFRIPYYFSACKQYPGKFLLAYMPRKTPKYEYVTVTPEGLRYRRQMFHSLSSLVRWFKEHFRDAIPGTPVNLATPGTMRTPMAHTPAGRTPARTPIAARTPARTPMMTGTTPSINYQGLDPAAIQRAAAGLPNSIYNSLAQVAGQTPAGGYGAGSFNYPTPSSYNYQVCHMVRTISGYRKWKQITWVMLNSLRPSDVYIASVTKHHWFR